MAKKQTTDVEPEEVEEETTEEETTDEESTEDESAEESEDESEEEEESEESSSTDELDLDAEIEKEKAAGKPDPVRADKAFKEREKNRDADKDDEKDKPLTQADLDARDAQIRREMQQERALELAKEMAGSDKEAELIVAKWANRTFPKNLSLRDQIQEAYVITHSKKLIGERSEAMRALKGKQGVRKDATGSQRDAAKGSGNEPKMSPADQAMIRASGFKWNQTSRQYEKKLPNGRMLIRDKKGQVKLLPKKQ